MPYKNKVHNTIWGVTCLLISIFYGMSCSSKTGNGQPTGAPVYDSEEFKAFYDRFGKDSIFQLAHTVFPLEGMRRPLDSLDIPEPLFRWQQENWVMHKAYNDMDGTFSREFIDLGGLVIERISDESGRYTMERRFGKLADGWHLIYYRELGMY
jgi:hypothetical protein